MSRIDTFKNMFKGADLEVEDLYLLESFQIAYWPGWVPERDLAAVLWSRPALQRFLVKKCPSISTFLERVKHQFGPEENPDELSICGQNLVWTIADLLVYNKCPQVYDSLEFHNWDFKEVTEITSFEDRIIIDGGSGTGRVALEAAKRARYVYAVEPVTRLRQFICQEASQAGLDNLYVVDGFLHKLPFPDGYADILVTSHALGWNLEAELGEFERVVKPGGYVIHCPGTADRPYEETQHLRLISSDWEYAYSRYEEADGPKRKYWKQL
jgi:SAM-dependent methyltransferase